MVIDSVAGALTMDVASEGNIIRKGTEVIVREVVDNFKNLSIEVVSSAVPYVCLFTEPSSSN